MKYPANVIWYVEARPAGGPQEPPQMGSAVVLRVFRPGVPASHRKVLLTCGHVVRSKSTDNVEGYGAPLKEFLCWRPGLGFTRPDDIPGRKTGACPGAMVAEVSSIRPLTPGDVSLADRRPAQDWVLLDVKDPGFQDVKCAYDLAATNDGETYCLVGFPGGAKNWQTNALVQNDEEGGFAATREGDPGTLKFSNGRSAPGMSGGGVFNARGHVVGLHRSQTAAELAFGAVEASFIRSELMALGWEVSPAPADDLQGLADLSHQVGAGMQGLAAMGQDASTAPTIQLLLGPLRPVIDGLRTDLGEMQACKECHEIILHRAAFKVEACLAGLRAWVAQPADPTLQRGAFRMLNALNEDAADFAAAAARCPGLYPTGANDAQSLIGAIADSRQALVKLSPEAVDPIQYVVPSIIDRVPQLVQSILTLSAGRLPFPQLAQAVSQPALSTRPGTTLEGLMQLLPLQATTHRLVAEHYAWQELDRELRGLKTAVDVFIGNRSEDVKPVTISSDLVLKRMRALQLQEDSQPVVAALLEAAQAVRAAIGKQNPVLVEVGESAETLLTLASRGFKDADKRLLDACQKLATIIQPLEQLLATLP